SVVGEAYGTVWTHLHVSVLTLHERRVPSPVEEEYTLLTPLQGTRYGVVQLHGDNGPERRIHSAAIPRRASRCVSCGAQIHYLHRGQPAGAGAVGEFEEPDLPLFRPEPALQPR